MRFQWVWMAVLAVCACAVTAAPVNNNSLYEKMKAERAAKAAEAAAAKGAGQKAAVPAKPAKTKGWLTDFEKAKQEAAEQQQPMFVLFTGSDWCPWCVKLEKEALDSKAFKAYAEENLILFKADFTQMKEPPKELKSQNEALASKFRVRAFPTVFLMDAEEKILGATGYRRGGGEAYVEHVKGLLPQADEKAADPKKK